MSSNAERVVTIIAEKLGIEASEVTLDANLRRDLGADSADLVELVMQFEQAFNVHISDEEAERFHTVNDVVRHLRGG